MLIPLLLLACAAEPPAVDAVSPAAAAAGDRVRVVGSNFTEGATVTIGGQPLTELTVRGAATIEGRVPEGLAPGAQDVVVTIDGASVAAAGVFTLKGAEPVDIGVPCAGDFTAYATVVLAQQRFVIDRRYKGDESKNAVDRIPFREVSGIEYEELPFEGEVCAAIWVKTRDGVRHLFDDDTEVRLRDRAQEIAVGVQKPFDIVAELTAPGSESP